MKISKKISFKSEKIIINNEAYKFKGFKFLELLPGGTNAIILKAEQPILKRIVIMKIWLNLKETDLRDKIKQGKEEAIKLSKLDHKNICKIYLVNLNKNLFYAVLEYIDGQTLKQFLDNKPSIHSRLHIWRQIASALEFSYKAKIYHGDLHTNNILICPDNVVKILDYGTSFFSGKEFSLKREKNLLIRLFKIIFQEYSIENFVEIDLQKLSPFHILRCLDYCIDMIYELKEEKNIPYNGLVHVIHSIAQCPLFKIGLLNKIREFNKSRGTYIGMLNSAIELARNPDLTSSIGKITSFNILKVNYLKWRDEYLQKDINTLIDI